MVTSDLLCGCLAGRARAGRGRERAHRSLALAFAALTAASGGRLRARDRRDDPLARRRGRPGRGQRAERHDREAGRDRRPGGRRRAAGGSARPPSRSPSTRRQLPRLGRARVADHRTQPAGRRDRGAARAGPLEQMTVGVRTIIGASGGPDARRLQRARQLRLRHRHGAVHRRLRAPAGHRPTGVRLPAGRARRRRGPDGRSGQPAGGFPTAGADHPRRRARATACPPRC